MFLARVPDAADERLWSGHLLGFLTYSKKRSMREGQGMKGMKQDKLDKLANGSEFLVRVSSQGELKKTRTAHVIGLDLFKFYFNKQLIQNHAKSKASTVTMCAI